MHYAASPGTCGRRCLTAFRSPAAGRYREAAPGNPLDFSNPADTSFDVIGPGLDISAGDFLVIYNLGITGADAYAGNNRRSATSIGTGLTAVAFAGAQFPFS